MLFLLVLLHVDSVSSCFVKKLKSEILGRFCRGHALFYPGLLIPTSGYLAKTDLPRALQTRLQNAFPRLANVR